MLSHWNGLEWLGVWLAHIVAGIRVELGEEISEDKRLHVSGADDDVFEGLGVVNRVVQSSLQLREEQKNEGSKAFSCVR